MMLAIGSAYRMLNGYKIIPTILNITSKALSKVGLRIKTGFLDYICDRKVNNVVWEI